MSSTQRGYDRHVSDYYITPVEKITEFLTEFKKHEPFIFNDETIFLDPTAGGDEFHEMSYPKALKNIGILGDQIESIDIRYDSRANVKGDYLKMDIDYRPQVIITNPPFLLAREIIEKALDDVADGGFVIMLLRLNFYGSKKRKDMFEKQLPKYSFVHNSRISFTPDGKTDSIEYQHCVWQKGYYPDFTSLKVI